MSKSERVKIFLTYSHDDSELSTSLVRDLRNFGLEAFFDVDSIKGGDKVAEKISEGLANCDVYIPILSFKALESLWCRDEINAAIALSNDPTRNGRPKILSVLAEDCKSAMWPLLRGRLYFSFVGRYEAALNDLVVRGLGLGVSSTVSPTKAVVRKVEMESVKADLDVEKDQRGVLIHLVFGIDGFRKAECRAVAYFYDSDGNPLKDFDDRFRTEDGRVSTGTDFSPGYDETSYEDLQLFIPYSQFHLAAGHNELSFYVALWDMKDTTKPLVESEEENFKFDQLPIVINEIWVDHNVMLEGLRSMIIHVNLDISDRKDEKCYAIAYFYNEDEHPLMNTDNYFGTKTGEVCAVTHFKPRFDETQYSDLRLSIPYQQLHVTTDKKELFKFLVEIHGAKGKCLTQSEWYNFLLG